MKWFHLLLLTILSSSALAQERGELDSFGVSDQVKVEGEVVFFANYFAEHHLVGDLILRTEMNQSVLSIIGQPKILIELPILLKHQVAKKTSLLFGPKIDLLKTDRLSPRALFLTLGMQYDATENLQFDIRMNHQISRDFQSLPQTHYTSGSLTNFKLGSRFKF